MVIIDKCGVRGDATLCVVIFGNVIFYDKGACLFFKHHLLFTEMSKGEALK